MIAKLLTELVGTLFLVLTIGLTVLGGTTLAPLAIGAVLTALVYMGGPVSGAHYNPAVTLAFWMRGTLPAREIGPYMAVQVAGALGGALVVFLVLDAALLVTPAPETSVFEFFLLETLFTFLLVLVILNVATAPGAGGNEYYGLAIGFVVLGGAFAAGPISGGAFNPAVALGPILVDLLLGDGDSFGGLWIYLAATFLGAVLAVGAFRLQHPGLRAGRPA